MFGSCAYGGTRDQDGNENEDPRRPKRREGASMYVYSSLLFAVFPNW